MKKIKEKISKSILAKSYNNEEDIVKRIKEELELSKEVSITTKSKNLAMSTFMCLWFNIGEEKYKLDIFYFTLGNKKLLPYDCLVFKGE